MDAIRKMTLSRRSDSRQRVPAMRQKGRLRVGADADITILTASTGWIGRLPGTVPLPVGIQH